MKNLIVCVLVTLCVVYSAFSQEESAIHPSKHYEAAGVAIQPPNEPGWTLLNESQSAIIFEKRVNNELQSASVKIISTKPFSNDRDRLHDFEVLKSNELNVLKRDSIHFNHGRFKSLPCLQYDGVYTGSTLEPTLKRYNFKGYVCPHPLVETLAVQLEISSRSNTRGFSDQLIQTSEVFFERATFPVTAKK